MLLTAVSTAGLVFTSIVPVANAHVEEALSVNWASEMDPAPMVRSDTAPRRATIPRRRARRRRVVRSTMGWSMELIPFPNDLGGPGPAAAGAHAPEDVGGPGREASHCPNG